MFRNYFELMRIPNVFTAMADVVMGFLFVQAVGWRWQASDAWPLLMMVAASSLLYLAGMVLNDVFDADIDARERPERPIPSGRISLNAASRLGWRLLIGGVVLGACTVFFTGQMRAGMMAALLATMIVLYDAWLKRTPLGPIAMGSCRTLNILFGMSAVDSPWRMEHWLVACGIGIYVIGVTWFARRESERSSRTQLLLALVVMLVGIGLLSQLPRSSERIMIMPKDWYKWYMLLGAIGAWTIWRCMHAIATPIPAKVGAAVAHCILSLVMLDAVCCFSVRGAAWTFLIFLFFLPTAFLGRFFKMT